jgi:hypothetical protein
MRSKSRFTTLVLLELRESYLQIRVRSLRASSGSRGGIVLPMIAKGLPSIPVKSSSGMYGAMLLLLGCEPKRFYPIFLRWGDNRPLHNRACRSPVFIREPTFARREPIGGSGHNCGSNCLLHCNRCRSLSTTPMPHGMAYLLSRSGLHRGRWDKQADWAHIIQVGEPHHADMHLMVGALPPRKGCGDNGGANLGGEPQGSVG